MIVFVPVLCKYLLSVIPGILFICVKITNSLQRIFGQSFFAVIGLLRGGGGVRELFE